MSTMNFTTTIDMALFKEYFSVHEKQLLKRKPRKYTPAEFFILIITYLGFGVAITFYFESFNWPTIIITSLFFIGAFFDYMHRNMRIADTIKFSDDGLALGTHDYKFSDDGIESKGETHSMHVDWTLVTGQLETKNTYIIQLDQLFAFILRKNDISNLELLKQYIDDNTSKQ